jgi:epoxyqueuosine reductase
MSEPQTNLFHTIQKRLIEKNFPVIGAVDYDLALPLYQTHVEKYQKWIQSGFHGQMNYLDRGQDRRKDPTFVFPNLKSIVVVLRPYSTVSVGDKNSARYARYLNGPDYHDSMKNDLQAVMQSLTNEDPSFLFKVCVDTSAVLERAWAEICGLGWIGKNKLLIHPQLGSYTFIGVVMTNQLLGQSPVLLKDYCGNCERCMQACPTAALSDRSLNSNKCISYLTLEHRGPWNDKVVDEKKMSGYVAGCDICQEVCPFNQKAEKNENRINVADYLITDPELLKNETQDEYQVRVEGTALSRIKFLDFKRNLTQF